MVPQIVKALDRDMKKIPIIFTFDENLSFPAAVCISSLMQYASDETFYDIYVLHSGEPPKITGLDRITAAYSNMSVQYRSVGNAFSTAYEIRGITKAAYYRLLAATLIPEYNKAIYADVDTLFRMDLSGLYDIELQGNYMGAVYAQSINTSAQGQKYLKSIGLTPGDYFCSGLLLMDLNNIRKDNLTEEFIKLANDNYKYQDQDIINIVCKSKILSLPYVYHMAIPAFEAVSKQLDILGTKYYVLPFDVNPLVYSNIHYNGAKPWNDWCPNLDQWWECYRKSPIYDPSIYFTFFNSRLEYLDQISLLKRIKILLRFFVYGRKK